MKFTDGYWLTKPEFDVLPAVQVYCTKILNRYAELLCAAKAIRNRGDTLNQAMLTVRFSTPAYHVIRVSVSHFQGKRCKHPDLDAIPLPDSAGGP